MSEAGGEISWENVTEDGLVKKSVITPTSMSVPLYPIENMELKAVSYTHLTLPTIYSV